MCRARRVGFRLISCICARSSLSGCCRAGLSPHSFCSFCLSVVSITLHSATSPVVFLLFKTHYCTHLAFLKLGREREMTSSSLAKRIAKFPSKSGSLSPLPPFHFPLPLELQATREHGTTSYDFYLTRSPLSSRFPSSSDSR